MGGGGQKLGKFPGGATASSAPLHVYKGVSEKECAPENLKDFEIFILSLCNLVNTYGQNSCQFV